MISPNRMRPGLPHFAGELIDRDKPLTFRLNGRDVYGFAGDTVLSAAIASGIESAGRHLGAELALGERLAPLVIERGQLRRDRALALPMNRTPAISGLDLVTLDWQRHPLNRDPRLIRARDWLLGAPRTLGVDLTDAANLDGPWFDAGPEEKLEADLVVVGGGVAGMGAALTAAGAGHRVLLVERRTRLGGDARLFGAVEGEEAPDVLVSRLRSEIAAHANVEVLLGTEAFALYGGLVRAHRVGTRDGRPFGQTLALRARRIVLAPGSIERLPVFPGNRAAGVVAMASAFRLAQDFGVWVGRKAIFSASTNLAYRLARQVMECGIEVQRMTDTRVNPQSRFIDFCKALGITMAPGLIPAWVRPASRGMGAEGLGGLTVRFVATHEEEGAETAPRWTERFVVSGGWQPDLGLWHMAGGGSRWAVETARLLPAGQVAGVALAGAAAGYRSTGACSLSGGVAVAQLFGRKRREVIDRTVDATYESLDAVTPIAPRRRDHQGAAYLDHGGSLAVRPAIERRGRRFLVSRDWPALLADQARALGVADIAAAIQLGIIPARDAMLVAQERCVVAGNITEPGSAIPAILASPRHAPGPPAFLAGRFGARPTLWHVASDEPRDFEEGSLLYLNSDVTDPAQAVGVIIASAPGGKRGGLAVIGLETAEAGGAVVLRDGSTTLPARLVEHFESMEAAAALPLGPVPVPPGRETTDAPPAPPAPPEPLNPPEAPAPTSIEDAAPPVPDEAPHLPPAPTSPPPARAFPMVRVGVRLLPLASVRPAVALDLDGLFPAESSGGGSEPAQGSGHGTADDAGIIGPEPELGHADPELEPR
ncbi:FAD-dependent oxidoreductase [Arsenicitalea aurantiaca]|uniref:FAD-dependent oxidoreductase n=1 Tax=Arsenicitalea aurantiaca TaxID=1783274 RepID=A0A433XAA2_9HYPH|nr:FAD-dependent oxidoreductase [Arsenicitalea aurantiaca]RUT30983.1 FAD-dependent oxidoreductase [Arsenicitalea aurantiaca]